MKLVRRNEVVEVVRARRQRFPGARNEAVAAFVSRLVGRSPGVPSSHVQERETR